MIRLSAILVCGLFWLGTLSVKAQCVDGICPSSISYTEISTGYFEFSIDGVSCTESNVIWDFGDGVSMPGGASVSYGYTLSGTYIVIASFTDSDCGGGGIATLAVSVNVLIPDCTMITAQFYEVDCNTVHGMVEWPGEFWYLTATWSFGDGTVSTGMDLFHSYTTPGTFNVTVSGMCVDEPYFYDLGYVTVDPSCFVICPTAIIALETGCHEFTYLLNAPLEDAIFEWDFGDGSTQQWNGLVQHTYADTGTYEVCFSYSSPLCGEQSFCTTVDVSWCTENSPCPNVTAIPLGCGQFFFEIGYTGDPTQLYANPGDGSPTELSVNSFIHQYGPGIYNVTVGTNEFDCPETVIEIFVGELCDCLESTSYTTDCFEVSMMVDVPQNSDLHWESEGMNFYSNESQTIAYSTDGIHEVCIHYQNSFCEMSEYYCFNVESFFCEGTCPDTILYSAPEIFSYNFQIPGAENASEVQWDFGDGTLLTDDMDVEHTFEPGSYVVSATLMDPDCPWDGPYVLVLAIEVYPCVLELAATENENGSFTFTAVGSPEVYPMYWDFGDGNSIEATWVADHIFDPGSYTVCSSIISPWCPDTVSACIEITVDTVPCSETLISFYSNVFNGGPTACTWQINNTDYSVFFEDIATFTETDSIVEYTVCLPNDCYSYTWCVNDVEWGIWDFSYSITIDGEPLTYLGYSTITPCGATDLLSIDGDCEDDYFCNAEFYYQVNENFPGWIYFMNMSTSSNIELFWDFGNGVTSDQYAPEIQFTENGVYNVCCTVVYEDCTDEFCQEITITGLGDDCFNLALEILGYYPFQGVSDDLQIVVSSPDGFYAPFDVTMSNSNMYVPLYFCLDDSCFELEIIDSNNLLEAGYLDIEWTWMDNTSELDNWNIGGGEGPWLFQSGISENCWSTLVEHNYSDLDVFPNPASDQISIIGVKSGPCLYEIFDASGNQVNKVLSQKNTLNISELADGLYLLKAFDGKTEYRTRFIVQN